MATPRYWTWLMFLFALLFLGEYGLEAQAFHGAYPPHGTALLTIGGAAILLCPMLYFWRVTLTQDCLVEHIPLLSRKRIQLSDLARVEETDNAYIAHAIDRSTIAVLKNFSGASGFAERLREAKAAQDT